jgi:hypothetical protein
MLLPLLRLWSQQEDRALSYSNTYIHVKLNENLSVLTLYISMKGWESLGQLNDCQLLKYDRPTARRRYL